MESPRGKGRSLILLALWALVGFAPHASAQDGYWGVVDLGVGTNFNDVFFFDADTGWIVGDGGFIRYTTTGGETQAEWLTPTSVPTAENLRKVQFLDALNGIAVGDNGVVLTTSDGGDNWSGADSLGGGLALNSVYFADLNNGWVTTGTTNNALYDTTTGSANLVRNFTILRIGYDVFVFPGGNGWLVGTALGTDYGLVWETTDGGASWLDITGPESMFYEYYAIGVSSASNVWVVGQSGVMVQGPAPWSGESFVTAEDLFDVAFTPAPNEDLGFAVGANGAALRTTDGGGVWTDETTGAASALRGVAVQGALRAWAVGDGGLLVIYRECITDGHCAGGVVGCIDDGACHPTDFTCGVPVSNGTVCEDGQYCTDGDTCQGGNCLGGPARDCTGAADQCNDGTCDEGGDTCVPSPVIDGTGCDAGDPCTENDTCQVGVCQPGSPVADLTACGAAGVCCSGGCADPGECCGVVECDDGNDCTGDECNSNVCAHPANTAPCDDGNECTSASTCSGGACPPGAPLPDGTGCTGGSCCAGVCLPAGSCCVDADCDDVNPCTDDTCVVNTCHNDPNADPCDDGDYCTIGDVCSGGICQAGAPRDCSALDDPCRQGYCDEVGDACDWQPIDEGLACDDGLFCNEGETCQAGLCEGGAPPDCSAAGDQCNAGVCDEGQDLCVPQPANEGQPCDDGLFCNDGETCQAGNCSGGGAIDCSGVADQCNTGVCNEGTDTCEPQSANNGSPCDDSDACTVGEQCDIGSCTGGSLRDVDGDGYPDQACGGDDCDDGNGAINPGVFEGPINDPVCSDGLDNDCNGQTDVEQASCNACIVDDDCDDANVCNGLETCPAGTCVPGSPLACDDGVDCTADNCDPAAGCQHPGLPDGAECGQRSCQGLNLFRQTCAGGTCSGLDLLQSCADANPCTTDTCDPGLGCPNPSLPDDTPCDDGAYCTDGDACQAGACVPGPARDCSVQLACRQGSCDEANDQCVTSPAGDGLVCDDGLDCSVDDSGACQAGACLGSQSVACPGGGECWDEVCTEGVGCERENWPDGAPCDDGDGCTSGDQCQAGVCVGVGGPDCSGLDEPPCIVGRCNPDSRDCEAVPDLGAACDDANVCTEADACADDGSCRGEQVTCPDCQACDPATGACVIDADTSGNACRSADDCDGVCDGEGICVVEAWCDRAIAGCDQLDPLPVDGEVDCRLEPDTVRLSVAPVASTQPQGGLALLRVDLGQGLARVGDTLFVRLRLRPDPEAVAALASYVADSATVRPVDVTLEETPLEGDAEVFFRLSHPDGLPASLGSGLGWSLEIVLEGPAELDPIVGLDVWAACGAEHTEPGCHKDFGPEQVQDLTRPLTVDGSGLDLQPISDGQLIHLSGQLAETASVDEFDNLILGCGCTTGGAGGAIGVGLGLLLIWGLRRRRRT